MAVMQSGTQKKNNNAADKAPRRAVVLTVLGLSFLAFSALGDNGVLKLLEVLAYKSELIESENQFVHKNKLLEAELNALQHDDSYIEQVARGTLSLVRDGETVYQFKETQH